MQYPPDHVGSLGGDFDIAVAVFGVAPEDADAAIERLRNLVLADHTAEESLGSTPHWGEPYAARRWTGWSERYYLVNGIDEIVRRRDFEFPYVLWGRQEAVLCHSSGDMIRPGVWALVYTPWGGVSVSVSPHDWGLMSFAPQLKIVASEIGALSLATAGTGLALERREVQHAIVCLADAITGGSSAPAKALRERLRILPRADDATPAPPPAREFTYEELQAGPASLLVLHVAGALYRLLHPARTPW